MRMLLIESGDRSVEQALDGHEIVRCHAPDSPAFPCAGLTEDGCPIEHHGPIDVAITVRPDDAGVPSAEEAGATCAIRTGLPMVVVGGAEQPFGPWSTTAASADELPGAIDRAITLVAERRAQPIVAEIERLLEVEGVDAGRVEVDVLRDGDTAHITIRTEREVDEAVAGKLATRAHAVDQRGAWPTSKVGVAVATLRA
jgi:hypothetical protein